MEWGPKHYVLGKGLLVKLSSFVPVSSPVISSRPFYSLTWRKQLWIQQKMRFENYSYDDAKGVRRAFPKGHDI